LYAFLINFALVTGGRGAVAAKLARVKAAISPLPVIQGGETYIYLFFPGALYGVTLHGCALQSGVTCCTARVLLLSFMGRDLN